jgi:hypothetical protein
LTAQRNWPSSITPIMAGEVCVGFIFARGRAGFEALDDSKSLGLFPDKSAAIAALIEHIKKNAGTAVPARKNCDEGKCNGGLPGMQETLCAQSI